MRTSDNVRQLLERDLTELPDEVLAKLAAMVKTEIAYRSLPGRTLTLEEVRALGTDLLRRSSRDVPGVSGQAD